MTPDGGRAGSVSSRPFALYAAILTVTCLTVLGPAAAAAPGPPLGDWRYWLFAALVLLGELMPIDVPRRDGRDRVTISGAFAFPVLMLFGVLPAVLAYAGASMIADAVGRLSIAKIVFNAAQYALAVAGAGAAMNLVGQSLPVADLESSLGAALVGATVFFLIGHVLAGVGVALLMGERPLRYLLADPVFQVLTCGVVLALAPVVVASAQASTVLVPLCALPTLAVYAGARQAIGHAHDAMHDALTDLPNRVLLAERLDRSIAAAGASGGHVGLMILDLDDFKAVNDTMGHAYGDRLLKAVSARLSQAVGPDDLLARLGGDEFAVLLPGVETVEDAHAVAQRFQTAMESAFELGGIALDVRASVGFACFPEHAQRADDLLRKADVALYWAKASEQPVAVYAPSQDHYTVDRLLLAGQLRRGMDAGEIVLEYQPKFPLHGGRPCAAEALARWEHPDLGRIGPDGFIPLAEHSGLINELTDVVLAAAIGQAGAWRRGGLDLRVSVNVSPRSLADPVLPRRIAELLTTHDLPANLLQLEITESRPVPSGHAAEQVLEELRRMGVSLAIDDFGTGFSSLVQLQRLPVDEIKIDRSFVANMDTSPSDAAIVRSTIDLARNLGLSVTAEGVETRRASTALADMGCELAQGYGLCRPLTADGCARVVRRFARSGPGTDPESAPGTP
ncbi:MAG: diguanylate cyclase/phosphodiesterase (GGDEF & EAL domains) with PAS/PAC sensor(s) [uncultured Solirubrobacteraceae bacterium]|uniref:Diguanylate cyclase/phosphodiesterase (GGDEF & EAL domains) with PAS/PAC sensor(S) n=1 Tax=uncultured Solirubrobacteraceae bacterium TaxID=1162706 RepID=A0A6J4S7B9_9ACTN|nr:MAG: diguanylate cyclase/phosphodiesterase (GGDEF & EAL domains) with PAS/PAC sensor(s) [uncultured Solirubrobacteraceae bacterium]